MLLTRSPFPSCRDEVFLSRSLLDRLATPASSGTSRAALGPSTLWPRGFAASSFPTDPYELLGVQRGVSDDDLKKAYRREALKARQASTCLAARVSSISATYACAAPPRPGVILSEPSVPLLPRLQWHPDRHPEATKPEAERRFKAISEAYQSLTGSSGRSSSYGDTGSSGRGSGSQEWQRARPGSGGAGQEWGYTRAPGSPFSPFTQSPTVNPCSHDPGVRQRLALPSLSAIACPLADALLPTHPPTHRHALQSSGHMSREEADRMFREMFNNMGAGYARSRPGAAGFGPFTAQDFAMFEQMLGQALREAAGRGGMGGMGGMGGFGGARAAAREARVPRAPRPRFSE